MANKSRALDYSKWDHIEVSDDEDDTHPNIDTASLFRWRHQARMERMAELEEKKKKVEEKKREIEKQKEWVSERIKKEAEDKVKEDMNKLVLEEQKLKEEEEEVKKEEKKMPWNVDTLSKDSWSKTVINKPKPRVDTSHLSEEEKEKMYKKFVEENESKIKAFGILSKFDDCKQFLTENPHLCCEDTANYLAWWCLNLEMEEKTSLMEHVAKQVIAMQYILELAKQLDCDPRSCIQGFFTRIQKADKEYQDAFNDELNGFKLRIKTRAKEKVEKIMKEIEEEERQKRLGPGGLDPVEVIEQLPESMQQCFESRDIEMLKKVISEMPEADASKYMKMCVDSGLWVPEANKDGNVSKEDGLETREELVEGDEDEPVYETARETSSE